MATFKVVYLSRQKNSQNFEKPDIIKRSYFNLKYVVASDIPEYVTWTKWRAMENDIS